MSISAVLLAGGESRRMGKDKATIAYRGRPLYQIQLELLRQLEPHELFVSAKTDPFWRPGDAQFVADQLPSRGPMSGIAAALSRLSSDHLVVLAIDLPFMRADYLRRICASIEPMFGVAPIIGDRAEPLAAIYPRTAAVDFERSLSGSDFSLQLLVRKLIEAGKMQPFDVRSDEQPLFRNLNELNDLERS
jgi:molybdenum cofactor guanylyltransferase